MEFEFAVDRGGTFTDVFCAIFHPDGSMKLDTMKLLSEDSSYEDSISEGIRRLMEKHLGFRMPDKIDSKYIRDLRIGTTVGTNALLERKGAKTALFVTKGFKDLLKIGN